MGRFTVSLSIVLIAALFPATEQQSCSYYQNGVSQQEKNLIVNTHNELRNRIRQGQVPGQPRGKNLQNLQWDDCLASEAQKLANLCKFGHGPRNCPKWKWIGQNIYWYASTGYTRGADWKSAIQAWFNEHKLYRYPNAPTKKTGHYTQVVWANTNRVGCGYLNYVGSSGYKYQKLYFCNYGPGGNIRGQAPYKT